MAYSGKIKTLIGLTAFFSGVMLAQAETTYTITGGWPMENACDRASISPPANFHCLA